MLASASSIPELLFVIVVIAFIPAIAEEFLFRGLVQRNVERNTSPMRAAVITGIIFGAYHLNPFSFVPLVALGIYLGFIAMRARSIWVSVAAHFFNNAFACIMLYCNMDEDIVGAGAPEKMSSGELLLAFWFYGIIFILSTLYFLKITRESEPQVAAESSEL
jgi:membrane protease YdiL (CAAX protease family)